ncbi:MAG: pyridoxamine 5'-phosphate oxidase family protein, partial [Chitinophagaceae bacterium]|nr:pyridoxamine 5'-phosphate oxidase family protein [Chitinophagaceae bacterium]
MNLKIVQYISKQTCATVCCVDDKGNPYCFNCFYVFNSEEGLLYFKSSAGTNHAGMLTKNPAVAGTILPDKLGMLQIRGVQFHGTVLSDDHPLTRQAHVHYYKKHPTALAMPGEMWTIQLSNIKMTDNTL